MINMTAPTSTSTSTATSCCGTAIAVLDGEHAAALADRLGALGDPVRLQILSMLAASPTGEVCACDFVGPIERSQPTISHHLKVLSESGIIDGDKRGRWIWYRLAPDGVANVVSSLREVVGDPVGGAAKGS